MGSKIVAYLLRSGIGRLVRSPQEGEHHDGKVSLKLLASSLWHNALWGNHGAI